MFTVSMMFMKEKKTTYNGKVKIEKMKLNTYHDHNYENTLKC